jgi:hypothetical protein
METKFPKPIFSKMVKSGARTFFLDLKTAKNSEPYMTVSLSELKGQEKNRVHINVFAGEIEDFFQALTEVVEQARLLAKKNS